MDGGASGIGSHTDSGSDKLGAAQSKGSETVSFTDFWVEQYFRSGLPGHAPTSVRLTAQQGRAAEPRVQLSWKGPPWDLAEAGQFSIVSDPGVFPVVEIPRASATNVSWDSATLVGEAQLVVDHVLARYREAPAGQRGVLVCHFTATNVVSFATKPHQLHGLSAPWQLALLEPTVQTSEAILANGTGLITASLSAPIPDVTTDTAALEDEAAEIAWLLSFALGRRVSVARVDLFSEDGWLIRSKASSVQVGPLGLGGPLPLDDIHLRGQLSAYIERGVAALRAHDSTYKLKNALHISTLARAYPVSEAIALLASNLLEVVRYNFGHNVLVAGGRAQAKGDDVCFPATTHGGRRMSFAELLDSLANHLAVAGWDPKFKDIRNSIVHQGEVIGANGQERLENVLDLLHFTDRLLLALLDCDAAGMSYFRVNKADIVPFRKGVV